MATSVTHRGWKLDKDKAYLAALFNGTEAFRITASAVTVALATTFSSTVGITGTLTLSGITSGDVLYMDYDNVCTNGLHLRCEASHAVIYINPRGTVEVDYPILVNIADGVTTAAGIYILNYKVASPIGIKIAMGGSGTMTDGIILESKVTAAGIVNGIRFSAYSVGSITYALSFKGITGISGAKVGAACDTDGMDSDAAVKIDIDGTAYFIPAFTAAHTSSSW